MIKIIAIISILILNLYSSEYIYLNNKSVYENNSYIKNPINSQDNYIYSKKNVINYNQDMKSKSSYGHKSNNEAINVEESQEKMLRKLYIRGNY